MQGAIQNKNPLVAQVRISHSKLDIQPFKNSGLGHNFSFQFMLGTAEQLRGKTLDRGLSTLSLQVKSSTGTACGGCPNKLNPHLLTPKTQISLDGLMACSEDAKSQLTSSHSRVMMLLWNSKPLQRPNEPTKSQVPRLRMRPVKLSHLGFSLESWALKTHLLFHGMRDFYPPTYPPHQTPVVQSRERSRQKLPCTNLRLVFPADRPPEHPGGLHKRSWMSHLSDRCWK